MITLTIKAIPLPPCDALKRASGNNSSILVIHVMLIIEEAPLNFPFEKLNLALPYFPEKIKDIWVVYRNAGLLSAPSHGSIIFAALQNAYDILPDSLLKQVS